MERMDTMIALSSDVYEEVERLARLEGRTGTDVVVDALREYSERRAYDDELTAEMNRALDRAGEDENAEFVREASRRVLERLGR
jgi:hypothetical protein